ncbi:C39 family peptidase [Nitrosomonas communis]|uniref:Peptidase C39 domain-containing protein n=1 Tax=Nitrosomonas communis TaxID=44574 RepID=A0A1I4P0X6_9PROT|nr:C39 family peptidase [Nitrosomonas communis]SFM21325.1 hypothetical protein SAMN05421863_101753 [Nitrosomonas communis]
MTNITKKITAFSAFMLAFILFFWLNDTQARQVKSLLEMRQKNVVVQKYDLSCGAAVLATLFNYHHDDPITERDIAIGLMNRAEYIKNPLIVRIREGFSLLDLKRFADARGYQGIGYGKLSLEHLVEKAPIIVPINTKGYNHFVIFRGMYGNRVLLADPAWGNRTMLIKTFVESWIESPQLGRVGFVVNSHDGAVRPNHNLTPNLDEFVMLQ